MFLLTLWEEIEKTAPDAATLERCYRLATNRFIKDIGVYKGCIWGKIKTSGATYYQVCWQLEGLSGYSNSPIKPKPDKYLLALAYYYCKNPNAFPLFETTPDWVINNLFKKPLSEKEIIEKEKENEILREKNQSKRQNEMLKGCAILTLWIEDCLRIGFAKLKEQPISYWEPIFSQLTDYKLNAISTRLNNIYNLRAHKIWIHLATKLFGELITFTEAFQKCDDFPPSVQQDLLVYGGVVIKKEIVALEPAHIDEWFVCAQEFKEINNDLTARTVWLYGTSTHLYATILSYSWRGEKWEDSFILHSKISGHIHFYPSSFPQRAILLNREEKLPIKNSLPKGYSSWKPFFDAYREAFKLNFLLEEFSGIIDQITVINAENLFLKDEHGKVIEVDPKFDEKWELIAFCQDKPISIFGIWDGTYFFPKNYA